MKKSKARTLIGEYLILIIGTIIFNMSWEWFLIPNGMTSGGLMGVCTIIQYATEGAIMANVSYAVINAVLLLIAIFFLGIGFGFRTIFCIAASSILLGVLQQMDMMHAVEGNFFYIREKPLIPIVAGVLEAVGVGLIIRNGGSTGGTDIVALMVNKYWPVSLSRVFLICDFVVITTLLLLPGKTFADMIYGYEMMVTFSVTIDFVIGGKKSSYQLMVFSEKYEDIADRIMKVLDRGVTILRAQGWYTKKDKNVLLVLISRNQLPEVSKSIKEIDPKAFMSVSPTSSVYGEGFEEIKAGIANKSRKK